MGKASDFTKEERDIVSLRDTRDELDQAALEARVTFRNAVADYLDDGGSATRLGKILGVSRGLLYQHRAAAHEDREKAATG